MDNYIIVGTMGSGKDQIAGFFEDRLRYDVLKLGEDIRKQTDQLIEDLQLLGMPRTYYQDYGQAMRDVFGEQVWNILLSKKIEDKQGPFIIADARHLYEVEYWAAKGFIPVGLHADVDVRKLRLLDRDGDTQEKRFNHISEIVAAETVKKIKDGELDGVYVENNGTFEELEEKLLSIVGKRRVLNETFYDSE